MRHPPMDYLLLKFSDANFPTLRTPIWVAAVGLLVVGVLLYNVQVRRLHRHPPLLALQEWLLWTAICVFGVVIIATIFEFYFFVVVGTLAIGIGTFIWVRFWRFPPLIEVYHQQLRRARFQSQQRYHSPEATVRSRKSPTRQRRRRR